MANTAPLAISVTGASHHVPDAEALETLLGLASFGGSGPDAEALDALVGVLNVSWHRPQSLHSPPSKEPSASSGEQLVRIKAEHPVGYAYSRLLVSRWVGDLQLAKSPRGTSPRFTPSDARRSRDYFVTAAALPWRCEVEHHGRPSKEPLWIAPVADVPKLRASPLTDAVEVGLSLRSFMTQWLAQFHRSQTPVAVKTFSDITPHGSVQEWVYFASSATGLLLCGLYAEVFPAGFCSPPQNERRAIVYAIEATDVRDSSTVWSVGKADASVPTPPVSPGASPGLRAATPPPGASPSASPLSRAPSPVPLSEPAPPQRDKAEYAGLKSQTPSRALLIAYMDWIGVRYGADFSVHFWVDPPTEQDPPLLFRGLRRRGALMSQPDMFRWYSSLFAEYGIRAVPNSVDLVAPRLVLPQFSSDLDVKHSGYVQDPRFHATGNFGAMADTLQARANAALEVLREEVADVNRLLAQWTLVAEPRYGAVGLGRLVAETRRAAVRRPRAIGGSPAPPRPAGEALQLDFDSTDATSFATACSRLLALPGEGEL